MQRALARQDLLERLAARILAIKLPHPTRVGIDGVDAAGKSTFAAALAGVLRAGCPRQVIEASLDGFHQPRAARYRQGRESPAGYYQDSFDLPALRQALLDPLGPGGSRTLRAALFDVTADAALAPPPQQAAPDALLVFDGVFLQRPALAGCFDLTIFLQVSQETMLARAVQRDQAHLGGAAAAAALYARRYLPAQQRYLAECQPAERADILIHNDQPDHPQLLRI